MDQPPRFKWEIVYIDDEKLVLRLMSGHRRCSPMIVYDSAEMFGWRKGDRIDVAGALHPEREVQKEMGEPLGEHDYILTNETTGTRAKIRKNDYEVENAWKWLEELKREKKVPC